MLGSPRTTNFIGFAGAASIAVPEEAADGEIAIENHTGVSYGVGILATVKNEFQLGVVLGRDKVGESANYEHNGKTWIAFSLGFEFSN